MSFPPVSLSLPVLALSSLHLFVLLAVSLCCSSSALHQIEADSCHQTYFRHWHTHNLAHSSLLTLCLSLSPVIPPSCCLTPSECTCLTGCVCVCPTWIGFWGLAPTTQNLQEDKSKKGIRPLLLPVSSCPSGKSGDGGSVLSLFASLSVGFLSHILYSLVITSQAWLSFLVSQSYCFWPVSICFLPFCSVEKKLHLSVCLFILHQKWPWWFCPSGQPFCLLAQVSFYSLFHS